MEAGGLVASHRSQTRWSLQRGQAREQDRFAEQRGAGETGWGEGSSHRRSELLLLPPGQRFHCGGKKKRRWVSHGLKAASSLLPVAVLPAERVGVSAHTPSCLSRIAQRNTSPPAFCSTDKGTRKTCSCR